MARIVIDNFQKGISSSPISGFSNIRCADIDSIPGVVKCGGSLTKRSGTVIPSSPISMVRFNSKYYLLDEGKDLYVSANGISDWAAVSGGTNFSDKSIIVWNGYLIGAYGTSVKAMSTAEAFTTLGTSVSNYTQRVVLGDDNKVYIVGDKISVLEEVPGQTFAPGTAATFRITKDIIRFHSGAKPNCAIAWNGSIVAGTDDGYIYRWDGVSDLWNDKIKTPENSINMLININRVVYAQCGNFNKLYYYNGSNVNFVVEIPEYITSLGDTGISNGFAEAIAEIDNKIYFAGVGTASGSSGIYSYNIGNGALIMEDEVSVGSTSDLRIGLIYPTSEKNYFVGWKNEPGTGNSYGLDYKSNTEYTGDKTVVESQLYYLASGYGKKTIRQPEINFYSDLTSNDTVKFYYRENVGDSWTLHATISSTGISRYVMNDIFDMQSIQIKVVLNDDAKLLNVIL